MFRKTGFEKIQYKKAKHYRKKKQRSQHKKWNDILINNIYSKTMFIDHNKLSIYNSI